MILNGFLDQSTSLNDRSTFSLKKCFVVKNLRKFGVLSMHGGISSQCFGLSNVNSLLNFMFKVVKEPFIFLFFFAFPSNLAERLSCESSDNSLEELLL